MIHLFTLLMALSLFQGNDSPDNQYQIIFGKIDNQVKLYFGDSLVYTSEPIEGNPDLNIKLNLNQYQLPMDEFSVKLYNGTDLVSGEMDRHWEIRYSLMKNNEEIDYQWESNDDFETGLVFEKTYNLK